MKKPVRKNSRCISKDFDSEELLALEVAHKTIHLKDWHVTSRILICAFALSAGSINAKVFSLLFKFI